MDGFSADQRQRLFKLLDASARELVMAQFAIAQLERLLGQTVPEGEPQGAFAAMRESLAEQRERMSVVVALCQQEMKELL